MSETTTGEEQLRAAITPPPDEYEALRASCPARTGSPISAKSATRGRFGHVGQCAVVVGLAQAGVGRIGGDTTEQRLDSLQGASL